jgi:hypothetical protein
MLISPTREEFKAAQSLQTHCELERIALLRSSGWRAPAGTHLSEPYTLNESHSSAARQIDDALAVEVSFDAFAVDANKIRVFSIECAYELCYGLKEGYRPTANEVEAFKSGNAIFNCWPYFREFFQNLTSRMGETPPPLPFLRVAPRPVAPAVSEAGTAMIAPPPPVSAAAPRRIRPRRKSPVQP